MASQMKLSSRQVGVFLLNYSVAVGFSPMVLFVPPMMLINILNCQQCEDCFFLGVKFNFLFDMCYTYVFLFYPSCRWNLFAFWYDVFVQKIAKGSSKRTRVSDR